MAVERNRAPIDAKHPLIEAKPKPQLGKVLGRRDLTRYVKWPRFIRIQRQKAILMKRLKVPPALAQMNATLDKNNCSELFGILNQIKPENKLQRRERITAEAAARAAGKTLDSKRPAQLLHGVKEVCAAIEKGRAKFVAIAHDVDPVELVLYLPALCRKLDVPFCFVRGKSRLGQVTGRRTTTCVAVTETKPEIEAALTALSARCMTLYNNNVELRRSWGGCVMSNAYYARKAEEARIAKAELK